MISDRVQLLSGGSAEQGGETQCHAENWHLRAFACLQQQFPFGEVKKPMRYAKAASASSAVEDERLAELRRKCATPAILLATNPTRGLRASAAELNAILIEKPLLEDELMRTLNLILQSQKAAS